MTKTEIKKLRSIAIQVAKEAGALLKNRFDKPRKIKKKAAFDLVTDVDTAANELITKRLQALWPSSIMLAEEDSPNIARTLKKAKSHDVIWIIDPIDGTTNYAKHVPHVGVSIAAFDVKDDTIVAGAVYDPFRDECFSAGLGLGAHLNARRISVSHTEKLKDALVATGFAYSEHTSKDNNIAELTQFVRRCLGVRRNGAASLDLAWVAAGRFDAYWEKGLQPWDVAAGMLLVTEAGGKVSTYAGKALSPFLGQIVSSNSHVHDKMVRFIKQARRDAKLKIEP